MVPQIVFIYNMASGSQSPKIKNDVLEALKNCNNSQIWLTEYSGHGLELAKKAIEIGVKAVFAVGGDGTVNEVVQGLYGSTVNFSIIPLGSGNGLARHLGIATNPLKAIGNIEKLIHAKLDVCSINNQMFVCTAGVGFDADVAHHFSTMAGRGLKNYVRASFARFKVFEAFNFKFKNNIDKANFNQVFSITFANAGQFGNNVIIAPQANTADGKIDAVIVEKFNWYHLPKMAFQLFNKNFTEHTKVNHFVNASFNIKLEKMQKLHVDGEPKELNSNQIEVKVLPLQLNILI